MKQHEQRLLEALSYDPLTGIICWKVLRRNQVKLAQPAGCMSNGYLHIEFEGVVYKAHNLAWFLYYKKWPVAFVDHKNRNKSDNSIANLRSASRSENNRNTRLYSNNKSGFRGVTWAKTSKKWKATIRDDGRMIYLGVFQTKEEASTAYENAALALAGEFTGVLSK